MSTGTMTRNQATRDQLDHVAAVLDECQGLSKATGVAVLQANWPNKSKGFLHARFELLMRMSPENVAHALGHSDPTGETAARNVDLERAA